MIKKYYMSDGDVQLSKHFMLHEFQSKNGCDEVLVDTDLIDMLEQIYEHFDCSMAIINDGYREPGDYCYSISGMRADAHAYGMAADAVFYDSKCNIIPGSYICCYAQDIGAQGIGYMGNAVHLDTRGNGGYKNKHWWGDETNGATVTDWHSYFGIYDYFTPNEAQSHPSEDVLMENNEDNNVKFEGGNIMEMDKNQLKYEVNRHALSLLGREIGGADTYVELLTNGELDWYEFDRRLQESEEGVKFWIKHLFVDKLGRIPDESEVNWWYVQYILHFELNKSLMAEGFSTDYTAFRDKYLDK